MTRLTLMLAIQQAESEGFHGYARALADLLRQQLYGTSAKPISVAGPTSHITST